MKIEILLIENSTLMKFYIKNHDEKIYSKKKNKTNLQNVQTKNIKNKKSQQKRIINSTFIVN